MSTPNPTTESAGWNQTDPHGHHEDEHHGHKIIEGWMLMAVLVALLALTGLTVAASRVEVMIAEALDMTIPQWVNVAIAMSIATVKAIIVALVFMQLIWDKKLHAFAMAVCLGCFGLFLGFTALDLSNRRNVFPFKEGEIVMGGTGVGDTLKRVQYRADGTPLLDEDGNPVVGTIGGPIYQWSKNPANAAGAVGDQMAAKLAAKYHAKPQPVTSANRRADMTGLRLFAQTPGEVYPDADTSGDAEGRPEAYSPDQPNP